MSGDIKIPHILGCPSFATAKALINVGEGKLTLGLGDEKVNNDYSNSMSLMNNNCKHSILLYNSRLCLFLRKLKSGWSGLIKKWKRMKTPKTEAVGKNAAPTVRGRLTYHCHCLPSAFVCNLIVARLDYLQGCLELKKEEQSRATNWGLIGAID
ncbi:hypothetical protein M9H77_36146 [Catharanthus roseus]|uniref:Uncharacterized protein n=1 Tax=Catharanthus roseus TaxID=4058 RepID=A0ACB9ZTJ6_CATRO|nr:hypothetical protein M9H77_36146 [Catharanthus roseus]